MSDIAIDRLAVWAVRYALGRSTYAVAEVVETLLAHSGVLGPHARAVIVRDIGEALAAGRAGMDMDRADWELLAATLADPGAPR